jgi:hypothetical protein
MIYALDCYYPNWIPKSIATLEKTNINQMRVKSQYNGCNPMNLRYFIHIIPMYHQKVKDACIECKSAKNFDSKTLWSLI